MKQRKTQVLILKVKAYKANAMSVESNIVYVKWLEDVHRAFLDK